MASKKHKDKIARHGGYNFLHKNAHLQRKKNKVELKKMTKTTRGSDPAGKIGTAKEDEASVL